MYQVLETSDLPGGVVNMVTGRVSGIAAVLAEHADLDAMWCLGDAEACAMAKSLSTGNLKQVLTNEGREIDWFDAGEGEGKWWLGHAVPGEERLGAVRGVRNCASARSKKR